MPGASLGIERYCMVSGAVASAGDPEGLSDIGGEQTLPPTVLYPNTYSSASLFEDALWSAMQGDRD
jgi:hypothetical protein